MVVLSATLLGLGLHGVGLALGGLERLLLGPEMRLGVVDGGLRVCGRPGHGSLGGAHVRGLGGELLANLRDGVSLGIRVGKQLVKLSLDLALARL